MQKKSKKIIAWLMLFLLIGMTLTLTYMKFFPEDNKNIEERPVNSSSSNAIHTALKDITTNFNQSSKVRDYVDENIVLKASVNNYSIYVSYITDTTVTYEFTYDDLCLNIIVDNSEEDKEKFNVVYQLLIEAVQKRLNNDTDIEEIINDFLTTDVSYDGLSKKKVETGMEYKINITKKIKNG